MQKNYIQGKKILMPLGLIWLLKLVQKELKMKTHRAMAGREV